MSFTCASGGLKCEFARDRLLVAFLAGGAADQTDDMLTMQASLGTGFYYFMAYCVFSVAASTVVANTGLPG